MKLITAGYKVLAKIECSVCHDSHVLEIFVDTEDTSLWFDFKKQPFSRWQRIQHWFLLTFQKDSFLNEKNRSFYSLVLTNNQVRELIDVLLEYGYQHLDFKELTENTSWSELGKLIEQKKFPPICNRKLDKNYVELYANNGLVISTELDIDTLEIGHYPLDLSQDRNHHLDGSGQVEILKEDVPIFLWVLRCFIKDYPKTAIDNALERFLIQNGSLEESE